MRYYFYFIFHFVSLISFAQLPQKLTEKGVSFELATYRKEAYKNVEYTLFFSVPENIQDVVTGKAQIHFILNKLTPVILDFTGDPKSVQNVLVNNKQAKFVFKNEHIIFSSENFVEGRNTIELSFYATDQSLNRRDDFLYTLLVPDRARTLFPCFDQPNIKACFSLTLEIPEFWIAVANGAVLKEEQTEKTGCKNLFFHKTEPISTYLFSFVCGRFEQVKKNHGGREISLYHRETDIRKIAQSSDILNEVFHSLNWLEEYTDIPYPFQKYDLIIIPGFQYGGMEHMGATLYADSKMFLESNATMNDSLNRSALITHETAHMWFGDFVTMEWFNDVWNKEVFANYFASQIIRPLYPKINHQLNFIRSTIPAAYAEDRSAGSMPIQQKLDNLANAGLVYSNIIYCKSPVVMAMLVNKTGDDKFRLGIREYLKINAYRNSDWDGLIAILDNLCDDDLKEWSNVWVKEKGMPTISYVLNNNSLDIKQRDRWERGLKWEQPIGILCGQKWNN